jgi:hypothetical protein
MLSAAEFALDVGDLVSRTARCGSAPVEVGERQQSDLAAADLGRGSIAS